MASPHIPRSYSKTLAHSRVLRILLLASWILLAFARSSPPLLAQDETTDITADEVNTVARQLWCPLCGGRLRLDEELARYD